MDARSGRMQIGQESAAGCWQMAALLSQTHASILLSGLNPKRPACHLILCALMAWLKGRFCLFLWVGRRANALMRAGVPGLCMQPHF